MPLKDVEARRLYEREQRKLERSELKQFREFKQKLKSCNDLDRKINALISSPSFNDVGLILQSLVTS
jgi:hypothetical protein